MTQPVNKAPEPSVPPQAPEAPAKEAKVADTKLTIPTVLTKESTPVPTIGRHPTDNELVDWDGGLAGGATVEKIYRQHINLVAAEYTKIFKPYDRACAIVDMRAVLDKLGKEKMRNPQQAMITAKQVEQAMPDFKVYGDAKRFTLVSHAEAWEPKGYNTNEKKLIGMYENYVCKRQHKFSIRVPMFKWATKWKKEATERGFIDSKTHELRPELR